MKIESTEELDRQYVLKVLNEFYASPSKVYYKYTDNQLQMFAYNTIMLLEKQSVRCKNCVSCREDGWCDKLRREMPEDGYCSFGRTDEEIK